MRCLRPAASSRWRIISPGIARRKGITRGPLIGRSSRESRTTLSFVYRRLRRLDGPLTGRGKQEGTLMVGFGVRRVLYGGAIALAALLLSPAAATAGACDAKKAQALIGKSESPRLEQKALELSGASD